MILLKKHWNGNMLVYIKPKSLFPELHSDKIFGAILSALAELYPSKINEIKVRFQDDNPPFLISSAFPFIELENRKIRFFPKIFIDEESLFSGDMEIIKKFDKIQYYQEDIFFKILMGEISINNILNNFDDYYIIDNFLLIEDLDLKNCYKKVTIQHNRINRLNNSNKSFFTEGIKYNSFCGVFFCIKIFDKEFYNILLSVFRLLKDKGFGSNISIGRGHFEYEIEKKDIYDLHNSRFSSESNYFVTLSRFIPSSKDITFIDSSSNYELGFKRSISRFNEQRNQVIFFKEGSTFFAKKNECYGKLAVTGKKSVEYGFAFPLKIKK